MNKLYDEDNIEEENLEEKEQIGYCVECKDPIFNTDEYVKKGKKLYCLYCYNVTHNIVEELDFDK